ncbi:MAG: efflux RND transporter periplasmic adaptor subunit [Gammaproteobacteria bacterium]
MNNRSIAKILLPVVVIAIAAGVFQYLKGSKPERKTPELKEKVWQVEVIPAIVQSLRPSLTLYGSVESPELLQAAAPGAGIISKVLVQNGSRVNTGQLLIKMDRRDFQYELVQAESDLRDIENQISEIQIRNRSNQVALKTERELLQLAEQELQRMQKLRKQNLGSDSALNEARSTLGRQRLSEISRALEVESFPVQLAKLEAMRDRRQSKFRDANLMIERSEVTAPFDGVISATMVSVGDRVSTGQILISLYPADSLEIRAHIPARYITRIQQAMAEEITQYASITLADGNLQLALKRLAGEAKPSGVDAYFQAGQSSHGLRLGALLPLSLYLPAEDGVIAVPYQAIYGNSRLYLLKEDRLQGIEVESVGQYNDVDGTTKLLVKSPQINPGDQIVITHLPNAVNGLKVRSVDDEASQ